MKKIQEELLLAAILGGIFILIISILDALIGVPKINHLFFHSIWFQVGLFSCLWLIAHTIMKYKHNAKDD